MRSRAWTGRATIRLLIFLALVSTVIALLITGCDDKPPDDPGEDIPSANAAPIVYSPFFAGDPGYTSGARWDGDVRWRAHGCDAAGFPIGQTGAYDPDGDELEYKFECVWSIFALVEGEPLQTRRINGEWVKFPVDDRGEQRALVFFYAGYAGDHPPLPIGPMSCHPTPPPATFKYSARDGNGGVVNYVLSLQ